MARRIRFTAHARQRLAQRGIPQRWVEAATRGVATSYSHCDIFVLTPEQLGQRFCATFSRALRVVVDRPSRRVVTAYWLNGDGS